MNHTLEKLDPHNMLYKFEVDLVLLVEMTHQEGMIHQVEMSNQAATMNPVVECILVEFETYLVLMLVVT